MDTEVLIVGSGIAGLYTALSLSRDTGVVVITNSEIRDCNSYLAQGGITTVETHDRDLFAADTMKAGGGFSDPGVIDVIGRESLKYIETLLDMGVEFERDDKGSLKYTREAAHSVHRIAYKGSETGKVIMEILIEEALKRKNIRIVEKTILVDLKIEDNTAAGAYVKQGEVIKEISSKKVVLATGGIGGLFKSTTNNLNIDGIALALAKKYQIKTRDLGYIQFHPTALDEGEGKRFLLSEALRGEGAVLRDESGRRFVDELQARDVVSREIMKKLQGGRVFLDATSLGEDYLKERFTGIYEECLKRGLDITRDMLPVRPAQHYYMGGVAVDTYGKSSCSNLYAVGEVSCTGLHGKNRLASNSLLEALVYSGRAAKDIGDSLKKLPKELCFEEKEDIDTGEYNWDYREAARNIIMNERGDLRDELSVG